MAERNQTFMCRIQADSREALIGDLLHFVHRLRSNDLSAGVSGGYSSGSVYAYRVNPDATHETYFRELDEMWEGERQALADQALEAAKA